MRFWDSSALVPLVVRQASSPQADRWLQEDPAIVVWTLTPVEIVSAIRRLVRTRELEEQGAFEAESLLGKMLRHFQIVIDIERVKSSAQRLLRIHALRAADALQLGAALAWASGDPADYVLHTFDRELALAAGKEGFRSFPRLGT